MTDLREQLARRLGSIKWPGLADPLNKRVADEEVDAGQGNSATWGDLADECIRQMEWARHPFTPVKPIEEGDWSEPAPWFPLTPAPNDWKPDA